MQWDSRKKSSTTWTVLKVSINDDNNINNKLIVYYLSDFVWPFTSLPFFSPFVVSFYLLSLSLSLSLSLPLHILSWLTAVAEYIHAEMKIIIANFLHTCVNFLCCTSLHPFSLLYAIRYITSLPSMSVSSPTTNNHSSCTVTNLDTIF